VCRAACTEFPQELIRRNKEGILLKDAANDDHRMGPHDVNDDIPAKLGPTRMLVVGTLLQDLDPFQGHPDKGAFDRDHGEVQDELLVHIRSVEV
jgi:hypothetical protein